MGSGKAVVAIDGMNYVHSEVIRSYALSIAMYVSQIARRIVDVPVQTLKYVTRLLEPAKREGNTISARYY